MPQLLTNLIISLVVGMTLQVFGLMESEVLALILFFKSSREAEGLFSLVAISSEMEKMARKSVTKG